METLTLRVTDEMFQRITDLAEDQQVNRSALIRELLAIPTFGDVTMDDLRRLVMKAQEQAPVVDYRDIHPQVRSLAISQAPVVETLGCKHPRPAIKQLPFSDVCTICGETVRHR